MYFAQTSDANLFHHDVDQKTVKRVERLKKATEDAHICRRHELRAQLSQSRTIKFSCCQSLGLFFMRIFDCILCCGCKKTKLWRLYDRAQERMDASLDIVKIVDRLNQLKVITDRLVENGTVHLHELYASRKNIIYVDTTDEAEEEGDAGLSQVRPTATDDQTNRSNLQLVGL